MGYTHYWNNKKLLSINTMKNIVTDFKIILPKTKVKICYEFNQPKIKPEIKNHLIRFNGIEEDGYETFMFTRMKQDEFCKNL